MKIKTHQYLRLSIGWYWIINQEPYLSSRTNKNVVLVLIFHENILIYNVNENLIPMIEEHEIIKKNFILCNAFEDDHCKNMMKIGNRR